MTAKIQHGVKWTPFHLRKNWKATYQAILKSSNVDGAWLWASLPVVHRDSRPLGVRKSTSLAIFCRFKPFLINSFLKF
jgi:hypothetical protein